MESSNSQSSPSLESLEKQLKEKQEKLPTLNGNNNKTKRARLKAEIRALEKDIEEERAKTATPAPTPRKTYVCRVIGDYLDTNAKDIAWEYHDKKTTQSGINYLRVRATVYVTNGNPAQVMLDPAKNPPGSTPYHLEFHAHKEALYDKIRIREQPDAFAEYCQAYDREGNREAWAKVKPDLKPEVSTRSRIGAHREYRDTYGQDLQFAAHYDLQNEHGGAFDFGYDHIEAYPQGPRLEDGGYTALMGLVTMELLLMWLVLGCCVLIVCFGVGLWTGKRMASRKQVEEAVGNGI